MKLVLISPEGDDPREIAVLGGLLAHGLERYHVRKPGWSAERLRRWLSALPKEWRARLVLHAHHELVDTLGLGGRHWRDDGTAPASPAPVGFTSRSCHDLATLRASLGRYDAVFIGPLFPSLSKSGYGPPAALSLSGLTALLAERTLVQRRTEVIALGGITARTIGRCAAAGLDGVAVLGAVWSATEPLAAFTEIERAAREGETLPRVPFPGTAVVVGRGDAGTVGARGANPRDEYGPDQRSGLQPKTVPTWRSFP